MTDEQLLEQAYPPTTPPPAEPIANPTFADWQRADGWIEAPYSKQPYGTRKVLGIDCEMVGLVGVLSCCPARDADVYAFFSA